MPRYNYAEQNFQLSVSVGVHYIGYVPFSVVLVNFICGNRLVGEHQLSQYMITVMLQPASLDMSMMW